MSRFEHLKSRIVYLPGDNIDTDQIIPARYLKTTSKVGLGKHLFADWRLLDDGSPDPEFPLNQADAEGAEILLAGDHFGCGSSREHAAWALLDWGFRAVISTSFADIFYSNALKNSLLPVAISPAAHARLGNSVLENPRAQAAIDLPAQMLQLPDGSWEAFSIDPFAKSCLMKGVDQLGYLLSFESQIAAYEDIHDTT
jgi:3-isopropylmalate/(R)-2-methylmalate dehydratase small subunit